MATKMQFCVELPSGACLELTYEGELFEASRIERALVESILRKMKAASIERSVRLDG